MSIVDIEGKDETNINLYIHINIILYTIKRFQYTIPTKIIDSRIQKLNTLKNNSKIGQSDQNNKHLRLSYTMYYQVIAWATTNIQIYLLYIR